MGVGEKGQEMRGLGRPPSHGRGCLEATARGPDAQMPPNSSQAQTQGALDFGGPGLVNGGSGAVPLGAQSTDIP